MVAAARNSVALNTTNDTLIGSMGQKNGFIVFSVSAASGSPSITPKLEQNAVGLGGAACRYFNLLADPRTAIDPGTTPITANGLYMVYAPAGTLYLATTQGSATINWDAVEGSL